MGPHWKLINIGSGNGLLPDRTKPLSDSILSGPQWVDWSKVCWNKSSSYLLECINPCRVEFILRKIKIDICISSQFSTLISRSMLVEDINLVILHIQYKLCWWPGDASTRVLAYLSQNIPVLASRMSRGLHGLTHPCLDRNDDNYHQKASKVDLWLIAFCWSLIEVVF